jgi:PAS domain S-box-containing protein
LSKPTPGSEHMRGAAADKYDIKSFDWSNHSIGDISGWTPAFRTALSMVMNSGFPSYIMWGKEFYVFYNDAYAPILGGKVALGQGCRLADLWAEIAEAACDIAERAYAGEPQFFKDRSFILKRNGQPEQAYFTFSFSPIKDEADTTVGVSCTIVETTDTVLSFARLKESQNRLQISLDASGTIGTWSYDPETNIAVVDDRFARLFQVDAATAVGGTQLEKFTNMIHVDDGERVIAAIAHAINTGEPYDIEYRIPQKSGEIIWISALGRIFEDAETNQKRFAGVAVDITARKKIEKRLFDADRRKDEFLAMLAHELRNPLAPIRAAADLLSLAKLDEQRIKKTTDIISRQVKHMTSLVDDLLDVSRVTRGLVTLKKVEIDLKRVVTDAVEQVRPLIEARRHRFTAHIPADLTHVSGDQKRLVQVLANVLNNAAKYTPEGGSIVLAMEVTGQQIELSVADNGIGMSPETVERAFELFAQGERTSDRIQGGLGIGLALVKSLVELHNGKVSASSKGAGEGSKFTLVLPLVDKPADRSVEHSVTAAVADKSMRVLIVDDNVDAANVLAMLLEAIGHKVLVEHDSATAIKRARTERPDICLLDIGLPDMDGNELAMQLRSQAETKNCKLIAITGYGQEKDRKNTAAAGFDHHLVKPIDVHELARLLKISS